MELYAKRPKSRVGGLTLQPWAYRPPLLSRSESYYSNALVAAQKELETLNNQAEIIERRRAQLQQTISSLKTLMHVAEDEERTLTDCIRIAVKGAQGYISAADVLKAVIAMGAPFSGKNMIDSVVKILSRLQKQDELLRDPNGKGYMWAGYVLHRLETLRSLTESGVIR